MEVHPATAVRRIPSRGGGVGWGNWGTSGRCVGREWFGFSGEPTSRPPTRVGQLAEPNARRWMRVRGREASISAENLEFWDILGRKLKLRVSTSAIRTVEKHGGIDPYLIQARNCDLAKEARALKSEILAAKQN